MGFSRNQLSEFSKYSDIKKHITQLSLQEKKKAHKNYLEEIKKWHEEIDSIDRLKEAVEYYYQLKEFQTKLAAIQQQFQNDSNLKNQLSLRFNNTVNNEYEWFERSVLHFSVAFPPYLRIRLHNALTDFEIAKAKIKIQYPNEYQNIAQKVIEEKRATTSCKVILQVIALFEDYHKKNSIFFFHWRHYDESAKKIVKKLKEIPDAQYPSDDEKIMRATKIIIQEQNLVADQMRTQFPTKQKKDSSFLRRAHFAIGLLDAERSRLAAAELSIRTLSGG